MITLLWHTANVLLSLIFIYMQIAVSQITRKLLISRVSLIVELQCKGKELSSWKKETPA